MAGLPATLRPPRSQLHCDMMTKARTSVCTQERLRRAEALGSARKSNDSIIVSIRACRWFKPQLPVEQRNDVRYSGRPSQAHRGAKHRSAADPKGTRTQQMHERRNQLKLLFSGQLTRVVMELITFGPPCARRSKPFQTSCWRAGEPPPTYEMSWRHKRIIHSC